MKSVIQWVKRSLRRRLLFWLLPAAFLAGIVSSIGTYWGAFIELGDLLNDQMKYLARHISVSDDGKTMIPTPHAVHKQYYDDKADEILLEIWQNNQRQFTSDDQLNLPIPEQPGLHDVTLNQQTWHTFTEQRGNKLIRIAQAQDSRWEALAGLSVHLLWPVLSLLPLLALFLWFGIGYGLRPLKYIINELARRDAESMEPVTLESLPDELKPLGTELNRMLTRLEMAFSMQKHFIADAAHELRTPLMALSIQAEIAQQASDDEERKQSLLTLQSGVSRLSHLVQQLLTLARLEPENETRHQPVELQALCKSTIVDHLKLAEMNDIDIGLLSHRQVEIMGNPDTLRILLNNLVDNAVRYTPRHGRVDLSVEMSPDNVILEVLDSGPGIPVEERARVMERFCRGSNQDIPGSGLGLSIVSQIAQQHGATVQLTEGANGGGLCVKVFFYRMDKKNAFDNVLSGQKASSDRINQTTLF